MCCCNAHINLSAFRQAFCQGDFGIASTRSTTDSQKLSDKHRSCVLLKSCAIYYTRMIRIHSTFTSDPRRQIPRYGHSSEDRSSGDHDQLAPFLLRKSKRTSTARDIDPYGSSQSRRSMLLDDTTLYPCTPMAGAFGRE